MNKKVIIGTVVIVVVILIIVFAVININKDNRQSEANNIENEQARQTSNTVMVNDEEIEMNLTTGGTISAEE